ncbi:hypothetical protein [Levilactobacillus suantsaii]|uniref:PLD phosphodiesterase domain-containing protein n=1 Tax=Levilactobacillus suantsaii TaxID=2292255 RepID=A0A4Q0VLP3_9LACO|nr:hypothetical protein [Levilactobacillus suantsaii]RXI79538.1 hypothetical protein DXH47_02095 [Levilactobacillus suantsaii]
MNSTFILYNGKQVDWSIKKILDTDEFDSFIGVTYSASPKFINHYLSAFHMLTLVVGIPEHSVQAANNEELERLSVANTLDSIYEGDSTKLYQALTPQMRESVIDHRFSMRIPIPGLAIHEKLYLLSNTDSGKTRVIIGSANLSDMAFNPKTNQMESLVISDDPQLYHLWLQHFTLDIKPNLTDYFPKELLHRTHPNNVEFSPEPVKSLDLFTNNPTAEAAVILSPDALNADDMAAIKANDTAIKAQAIQRGIQTKILSPELPQRIQEITNAKSRAKQAEKDNDQKIKTKTIYKMADDIITVKKGQHPTIAPPRTLTTKLIKTLHTKVTQPVSETVSERPRLLRQDTQFNPEKNESGLLAPSVVNHDEAVSFGRYASLAEIKSSLQTIATLIASYTAYTIKPDKTESKRVYETILYAFTAPFISYIRNHLTGSTSEADVPLFLFIGGRPGSGKTLLLTLIAKMIKLNVDSQQIMNYASIVPQQARNAKDNGIRQISRWLIETKVYPLLIDEVPDFFFSKARDLIVDSNNTANENGDEYPVFIGTTNTVDYHLNARAARRAYYLKISNIFDKNHSKDCSIAYEKVANALDNTLFKDFLMRFEEKIHDVNTTFVTDINGQKHDFLIVTRQIFEDYYTMCHLPLPDFFPKGMIDDAAQSGRELWRNLYLSHPESFTYQPKNRNLLYDITNLDTNAPKFGDKPSQKYKEALPPTVFNDDFGGNILPLSVPEFFTWIDVTDPYQSHSILASLIRPFRK